MGSLFFRLEKRLVLRIGILEVLELGQVLCQGDNLLICLRKVVILLLRDVLQLLLVALTELSFDKL